MLKDALFMIFLKSFHYQNLEWHEFMPDDLKLHENHKYMSWICFRGDKIRAHNIPSITVNLTPWEKQNNAACASGHLQLPSLSMKNPEPYKTQLLHCKFPYANEQFI